MNGHDVAFELRVPAEAALASTVRCFVGEAARRSGLDVTNIEDLRLIATELLANAVDTGERTLHIRFTVDDGRWRLDADGAGALRSAGPDEMIDREQLLRSLATIRFTDQGALECSPLAAST